MIHHRLWLQFILAGVEFEETALARRCLRFDGQAPVLEAKPWFAEEWQKDSAGSAAEVWNVTQPGVLVAVLVI